MNKLPLSILIASSLPLSVMGFEVNTHQALTRCAITTTCHQEGAKNLDAFARNTGLNDVNNYGELPFEGYASYSRSLLV